jgi:hypothetical protein
VQSPPRYAYVACDLCEPCEHSAKKRKRRRLPKTPEIAAARVVNELLVLRKTHGDQAFAETLAIMERALREPVAA